MGRAAVARLRRSPRARTLDLGTGPESVVGFSRLLGRYSFLVWNARQFGLCPGGIVSTYLVSLDVFEGPLDLLLRLIEREELDITVVSLAVVTDQYLAHVSQLQEVSAANLADFLVIAAKLLVIKSRALLPRPEREEPEETEEDLGEELVRRLQEYKRFKQVAIELREIDERGLRTYPREVPPPDMPVRVVAGAGSTEELVTAFRRVLAAQVSTLPVDNVVAPVVVHLDDCIRTVLAKVGRYKRLRFSTLMRNARSRMEIIVTFLAMLQLISQQRLLVTQERVFGEIYLEPQEPDPKVLVSTVATVGGDGEGA